MPAPIRSRLTYANVVATLALFVALGGSAYAVAHIGTKQVRNRSLKGIDLKRNTVTGKEVNESKLARVPRASAADQAASALNAVNASLAALATNAEQLGGQQPAFFERSSRTQFGRAEQSPADAAGVRTLLEWPEMNMRVETVVNNNGCSGQQIGLRFRSTSAASSPTFRMVTRDTNVLSASGISLTTCSGAPNTFEGAVGDETGRTLYFRCLSLSPHVRCFGERSQP